MVKEISHKINYILIILHIFDIYYKSYLVNYLTPQK